MKATASRLVAHRGLQRLYPENTLASVLGALHAGLTQVEIDVQLSADGVPVVYHDATLRRVSGRDGDVRRLTWAQLRRLPAHEPARFGRFHGTERIASLEQLALALAAQPALKTLFVELKEESLQVFGREAMLQACADALRPIHRRCVLISFDLPVLALARRDTRFAVGAVLTTLRQLRMPAMKALRPEWVFCDAALLPERRSLRALFGRTRSAVYEVPQAPRARDLLARGVTAIETFCSDSLLQELRLHR